MSLTVRPPDRKSRSQSGLLRSSLAASHPHVVDEEEASTATDTNVSTDTIVQSPDSHASGVIASAQGAPHLAASCCAF